MTAEPFVVKTSAQFTRLHDALEWAIEHCSQGPPECSEDEQTLQPMLMIASQKPYIKRGSGEHAAARRFIAVGTEVFSSFFDSFGRDENRHLHEVVPSDAPCKLAIDCDWEVAKLGLAGRPDEATLFRDLDASFGLLVPRVIALIAERYKVQVSACLSGANRPGKWSQHAIFDGALWKNNQHCAALMREIRRADVAAHDNDKSKSLMADYIDPNIYATNHTLRMYRSSKIGDEKHSFRRHGEPITAPVDRDFLRRSMITLFPIVGDSGQQYFITSLFARRFAERLSLTLLEHEGATFLETARVLLRGPSESRAAHLSTASWTSQFIEAFSSLGAYEAEPDLALGTMRLRCLNHDCAIKGARHSNENIFLQVDLVECLWRQNCFNATCCKTPTEWQALPDDLVDLCNSVYAQWPGAQRASELAGLPDRLAKL